jgi:hypothetical protein
MFRPDLLRSKPGGSSFLLPMVIDAAYSPKNPSKYGALARVPPPIAWLNIGLMKESTARVADRQPSICWTVRHSPEALSGICTSALTSRHIC